MTLRIAVPNKGRLSDATLELLKKAGLKVEMTHERALVASALDDAVKILFVRAQDVPEYVQDGVVELGVTGLDIVEEAGRKVERLMDLGYGRCRLVVAAPEESGIASSADVPDGARVATSFPNVTRRYFEKLGKRVDVVEVSGAAEVTPHLGVADLITDLTSSGSTLLMNHLREVDTILTSTAWMVGNAQSLTGPRAQDVRELLGALESVVNARGKRYVMANVPKDRLEDVRRILPGIRGPTIMDVMDSERWVAAHAVVDERTLYRTVNALKEIGATGILVLPIERLVP